MSRKLPAIQFYTGDWIKDPDLSKCSAQTRGIWIDALCAMYEAGRRGILSGTPEQLARICRCSPAEIVAAAEELKATQTACVTFCNGDITLVNRRMHREEKARKQARERVSRHRNREEVGYCNADVTSPSSSSSSTSVKDRGASATNLDAGFARFWALWPKKIAEEDARKAWAKISPDATTFARIIEAVQAWARSDAWQKEAGRFVPGAAKWLAGLRWTDELPCSPEPQRGDPDWLPDDDAPQVEAAIAAIGGRL